MVFVGAERGLEARVLPTRGEEHVLLPVRGIDRSRRLANWRALTGLLVGLCRVLRFFGRRRPELVVVTGGYAGAAAGIAAGLVGVPLVLQEQNSVPGVVTKLLTRWAMRVHVAFPEAIDRLPLTPGAVRVTGNPVRDAPAMERAAACAGYGLPGDAAVVVVVGGSQGSVALNRVVLDLARAVAGRELELPAGVHLLWATGPRHYEDALSALGPEGPPAWLRPVPYFDDMPAALACADLAVSRAGAMSTAELLNQGLPAVLVPLPTSAEDHQMHNARALQAAGAATVIPQHELTAHVLAGRLSQLLGDRRSLAAMRERALARARPGARTEIAADVASLLPPSRRAA